MQVGCVYDRLFFFFLKRAVVFPAGVSLILKALLIITNPCISSFCLMSLPLVLAIMFVQNTSRGFRMKLADHLGRKWLQNGQTLSWRLLFRLCDNIFLMRQMELLSFPLTAYNKQTSSLCILSDTAIYFLSGKTGNTHSCNWTTNEEWKTASLSARNIWLRLHISSHLKKQPTNALRRKQSWSHIWGYHLKIQANQAGKQSGGKKFRRAFTSICCIKSWSLFNVRCGRQWLLDTPRWWNKARALDLLQQGPAHQRENHSYSWSILQCKK